MVSIDFTNLALAAMAAFGVFGWVRGARRIVVTTGGIFFAMAVVDLMGQQFLVALGKLGVQFRPAAQSSILLAALFVFTVYMVQLFFLRVIMGGGGDAEGRQDRLQGIVLGLVNGFLIVATTMRYANPFLAASQNPSAGGWTLHMVLPQFNHPDATTVSFGIAPETVHITPSPLLRLYDSLPTALVFLFAFLVFVFLGTVYGRVSRSRG